MSLTLKNKTPRLISFILEHDTYCLTEGACACHKPKDAFVESKFPSSLHLPSGSVRKNLSESILLIPDVREALRKGWVSVTRVPDSMPHQVSSSKIPQHLAPQASALKNTSSRKTSKKTSQKRKRATS